MPPKQPRNAKATLALGVSFIILGLLSLPLALGNPEGATRLGIPYWFALAGLWAGGLFFIGLGWFSRKRRREPGAPDDTSRDTQAG